MWKGEPMNDLINRQAAIDALAKVASFFPYRVPGDRDTYDQYNEAWQDAIGRAEIEIEELPSAQPDNQVHLCDSCSYTYPECPSVYTDVIFGNGIGNDNICACNKCEPSAQPEQQWIPCSERLPEVGTYVLVSKKALGFKSNLPNVCTAHRICDPRSGIEEWNDMLFGKLNNDDVLAWMPLPEQYAERRTDETD